MTSLPREPAGTAPAVEAARDRAALVAVVDGAADRATTLSAFGRALSFPAYYGHNLDALEECLRDLSWLPAGPVELVWADGPLRSADPGTHDVVTAILADAVAADLGIELLPVGTDLYGVDPVADPVAALDTLGDGDAVLVKASRVAGLESLAACLISQGG